MATRVVAENLYIDPAFSAGAADWVPSGATVTNGVVGGGISVNNTGTGYAIATNNRCILDGLAGATKVTASIDLKLTGTNPSIAAQFMQVDANNINISNAATYLNAPPDAFGSWYRMIFIIALAAGAVKSRNFQLIRGSGGVAGDTTKWRNLRVSVGDGNVNPDLTTFFSGDTVADNTYSYKWVGTPNASVSQKLVTINDNKSKTDSIMDDLISQGFLTGSIVDREYARLLAKTGASRSNSLYDLYRLAGEPKRIF